jgi:hypothetical protein
MSGLRKTETSDHITGSYVLWELYPKAWKDQGIFKKAFPKEMQWCAIGVTLNTYEKPLQRWNSDVYYDKHGKVVGTRGLGGATLNVYPDFAQFFKSLKTNPS